MTTDPIAKANITLRSQLPLKIVQWAIRKANGRAVISTNFRPYEAVILDLVTQVQPDIPVIWADHGCNRPATYKHAEQLKKLLKLNLKIYVPKLTVAHYNAVLGDTPNQTSKNEELIKAFSGTMKLEPFQRAMTELAPTVWFTALRQAQNQHRASLNIVNLDMKFNSLKVNPLFYWNDTDMENYLSQHQLPNEWDYFDPAKVDDKSECGLHS